MIGQSDEKCYVVVDSSEDIDPSLLSNISISLISKFLRDVEQLPPSGISLDSCQYQISVSKNEDTTFVTFKGEGLNSYGDSKLSGSDGFQQSILKSLYRSLEDKRDIICKDYGTLLEECNEVIEKQSGVLFGTYSKTKWEDGGEWINWYKNDGDNRYGRYKGEIENGKPNGQGTVKTTNGEKYVGEYKDGKENGQGIFTKLNGYKYVGEWKDGKQDGQGKHTRTNGEKYVGEWKDGKQDGQGTFTYTTGQIYVGEFKDGKRHGQGTMTLPDGGKYVGEWRTGDNWNGIIYDKYGNNIYKVVNGEWIKQKLVEEEKRETVVLFLRIENGKKGWFWEGDENDDTKYVGEIEKGRPHGMGTVTFGKGKSEGQKYIGEWKDGRYSQGTFYDKNGNITGKYVNGEYIKQ